MILHIIDDEKFLKSAITLFETIYPDKNIFFVGLRDIPHNDFDKLKKITNSVICENSNSKEYKKRFISLSENVELVLFHNLYEEYKLQILNKLNLNSKTAWYFWGAELYGLNPKFNTLLPLTKKVYLRSLSYPQYIRKVFLSKVKRYYYWQVFKYVLKEKIGYVLTNIQEDIDLLEFYTKSETPRGWFTYYSFNDKSILSDKSRKKKHILIGNSSSETNNHFDTFNLLLGKKINQMKLYIPLNYGDKDYANLVSSKAKEMFREQAVPILDFLSIEEYITLIDNCSVLIMNHIRQQAFNTIMIALANGCKVYLREENTIYKALKREGFIVFSIQNDIEREDAFNELSIQDQKENLKFIKEKYSKEPVFKRIKKEIQQILNEKD